MRFPTASMFRMTAAAAVIFLAGCAPKIEEDFVMFDQAYVTAVVTASQGNAVLTRQAMENLTLTWDAFNAAWAGARPDDAAWQGDFTRVGGFIGHAAAAAASGSTATVYHALDSIAPVFRTLRSRNGIEYFLDYLTAFKKELTALNAIVADKSPAGIKVTDIISLEKTFPRADAAWRKVTSAPFDRDLFDFCKLNVAYLKNNIARERKALDDLGRALADRHKFNIIKYTGEANRHYNRLFIVFGNFGCLNPGS